MEKETIKEQSHELTLKEIQEKNICLFGLYADPKEKKRFFVHALNDSADYKAGVKLILKSLMGVEWEDDFIDEICNQNNYYEVENGKTNN